VRDLPSTSPGAPRTGSPWRYLGGLLHAQRATSLRATVWASAFTTAMGLVPVALGRGVDEGLGAADGGDASPRALLVWSAVVVGLVVAVAAARVLQHRASVGCWLEGMYLTTQHVSRHLRRAGTTVVQTRSTGEVVSTVGSDADRIGGALEVLPRFLGAVVAAAVVTAVLLVISPFLGLVVVVGLPACVLVLALIVRPLHARQSTQRELSGALTALGADTVAGLRVLRGLGGERVFADRYRARSRKVLAAGEDVARVQAVLEALQALLPGLLTALVVWLGARAAVEGRITPGDLVTFYGVSAFLLLPLRTGVEAVAKWARAYVGARHVLQVLCIAPPVLESDEVRAAAPVDGPGAMRDPDSGVVLRAGELTAIVSRDPADAARVAARLGRDDDSTRAELDGVPLTELPLRDVRRRVVLSEAEPSLFSGPLRETLDPGRSCSTEQLLAALEAASAGDAVSSVPGGLSGRLPERGRSLSGGQRQRLGLARALLASPTCCCSSSPRARSTPTPRRASPSGSGSHRSGRTTAVATASPLLLERADRVLFLVDGRVRAEGRHHDLLAHEPRYRDTVTRGEDS
jgi:ABC-type multidrug transport system fused ATPase/permease subunit